MHISIYILSQYEIRPHAHEALQGDLLLVDRMTDQCKCYSYMQSNPTLSLGHLQIYAEVAIPQTAAAKYCKKTVFV